MAKRIDGKALKKRFDRFAYQHEFKSFKALTSGHINDTFFIETDGSTHYILQRINGFVFPDVPGLVNNKVMVSVHLLKKSTNNQQVLQFVKVKDADQFYIEEGSGEFWNLMIYIQDSITHEIVQEAKIAYEGGRLLGDFLNATADFDAAKLIEVIPKFHDMAFRFQQFEAALKKASSQRLQNASKYISIIEELREEMHILQHLKNQGKIPIRVTHNDTKISNALFDKNNKGICMIDTDTVMPGIVHYDFGDAIRTICNTAAEDEGDLNKVDFNKDFYDAYLAGFLSKTQHSLTNLEVRLLPLAAKTMIFIMALRFLTDYLNNDVYYKTNYEDHNLVRAKNQLKLIERFTSKITYDTN